MSGAEAVDYNLSRRELMDKIMWYDNRDSLNQIFGPQAGKDKSEPKSIVAVKGVPERYRDYELRELAEISDERTEKFGSQLNIANPICIEKREEKYWLVGRLAGHKKPRRVSTVEEVVGIIRGKVI